MNFGDSVEISTFMTILLIFILYIYYFFNLFKKEKYKEIVIKKRQISYIKRGKKMATTKMFKNREKKMATTWLPLLATDFRIKYSQ